jgi:putative spermidine/putrescine transport system ATP-binding protein
MDIPASGVRLDAIRKSYGLFVAVDDVSLDIPAGTIVSLLGPSGCGKTTTLRMIAGLEHPDSGTVQIGGQVVNSIPPWKRNIGMMFQNYALFPHLTVGQNIAYGLRMRRAPKAQIRVAVTDAMAQVQLTGLEARYPSQLSGGQRQRVALARAIITRPNLLLLDEPLGALDKKLREQMQVELKQLQRDLKTTMVFVTHDQEEALALSDTVVVMDRGRVVQVGTPVAVYENPAGRFVSDFIGTSNVLKCPSTKLLSHLNRL